MAAVPCGHRCMCPDHAQQLVSRPCPICRVQITSVLRVFDA
jgi:hypothetical protein